MMPFSLFFHGLKSINLQTELLESCDWDNAKFEETIEKVTKVLDSMVLPDIPCDFSYFKDKVLSPAFLEEKIDENQIKIIIKYMEHDAKFVSHILNLPEN